MLEKASFPEEINIFEARLAYASLETAGY